MVPASPDVAVVIEVRRGEGPVEAAAASCSEVLGEGRCRAVAEGSSPGHAEWYALVVFDEGTMLSARVELRRAAGEPSKTSRDVRFVSGDSLEQRYRAIGLIAAAQVLGVAPELAPHEVEVEAGAEPTREPPPALVPAKPPASTEPGPTFGLDLAAFLGSALDRGPPRIGLSVRPWFVAVRPLLLELGASAAIRPDDPLLIWGTASAALVLVLTPEGAPLEARAARRRGRARARLGAQ